MSAIAKRINRYGYLPVALLLLGYTAARSYMLGITYDEAFSYLFYVLDSVDRIISYTYCTANNHVLGSLLEKLSTGIFSLSEFSLRLPSLLSHVLFLIYSWKILKDIPNVFIRLLAYLLLNTNPFLLDFFSLARGYSLSAGCLLASLYYLRQYIYSTGRYFLYQCGCLGFGALAVLSNFSVLNSYLALTGIMAVWTILKLFAKGIQAGERKRILMAALASHILLLLPCLYYTLHICFMLRDAKELYFGGNEGVWINTVCSLVNRSLYEQPYLLVWEPRLQNLVIAVLSFSLLYIVIVLLRKRQALFQHSMFISVLAVLLLAALGTVLQYKLFHTLYLRERTALQFLVLFLLLLGYALYYLWRIHRVFTVISVAIPLLAVLHFMHTINFRYVLSWQKDADIKPLMQQMEKEIAPRFSADNQCYFKPTPEYFPATTFYQYMYQYTWMAPFSRDPANMTEDVILCPDEKLEEMKKSPFRLYRHYPFTGCSLLLNPRGPRRILLDTMWTPGQIIQVHDTDALGCSTIITEGKTALRIPAAGKSPGYRLPHNSWFRGHTAVYMHVSFEYYAEVPTNDLSLYFEIDPPHREAYESDNYMLLGKHLQYGRWNTITYDVKMPDLYNRLFTIDIKLHNNSRQAIKIGNMRVQVKE